MNYIIPRMRIAADGIMIIMVVVPLLMLLATIVLLNC